MIYQYNDTMVDKQLTPTIKFLLSSSTAFRTGENQEETKDPASCDYQVKSTTIFCTNYLVISIKSQFSVVIRDFNFSSILNSSRAFFNDVLSNLLLEWFWVQKGTHQDVCLVDLHLAYVSKYS